MQCLDGRPTGCFPTRVVHQAGAANRWSRRSRSRELSRPCREIWAEEGADEALEDAGSSRG